jgi:L-threonylcarbamoyladenylate synthase
VSYVTKTFDDEVVRLLKNGAVGVMPSDTIYGLSARTLDKAVVEKLYKLKDRSSSKPFIILISNLEMLDLLSIPKNEVEARKKYWPGSVTLICSAPQSPEWLHRGLKTLAIRWPDHKELLELINQVGPIISTSANIEGQIPARSANEAKAIFGDKLDFYIDAGELPNSLPSTIVKSVNGELRVVRQGAVKL